MEYSRNPNAKRPLDHGSPDSPLLKKLRPELLELLEHDSDLTTSDEPHSDGEERDLESVIRSFEKEIARGEGELGFLLHASDDELGLPPPSEPTNPAATEGEGEAEVEVGGDVALVSDLIEEKTAEVDVGFDAGLLGWCDDGLFGPLDLSDLTWQPMPAV